MSFTFSLTALPLLQMALLTGLVMGIIHWSLDRLDPGLLSPSTTTEHNGNFSLICQPRFSSQTSAIKTTLTCGSRGAQSLLVSVCLGFYLSRGDLQLGLSSHYEERGTSLRGWQVKVMMLHQNQALSWNITSWVQHMRRHTPQLNWKIWWWHLGIL